MTEQPQQDMMHEEVAFNLVTINAILEFLEKRYPGAKQEVYEIGQRILRQHRHPQEDPE